MIKIGSISITRRVLLGDVVHCPAEPVRDAAVMSSTAVLADELPKTRVGKVRKDVLRNWAQSGRAPTKVRN